MIYTVTFNPSLDYIVKVDSFRLGEVNRTYSEKMLPGGKGINVSIVLKNLGIQSVAMGFIAGFTGDEIQKRLNDFGCESDFIRLQSGLSRINVKLKSNEESEINGRGPRIREMDIKKLFDRIDRISDGDVLVLAGSIPNTLPEDIYEKILDRLKGKNILAVVDATRNLLVNVLKYHPFLIKPNNHELGELFGRKLQNDEDIIRCAKELQSRGARNVLVSMAGEGAILVEETGKTYKSPAPKGVVRNSVGAGDSMVAGFLAGYLANRDYQEAFRTGIAAGSASAFSEDLASKEDIQALLRQIETIQRRS
ncbi:1-phosphofructokinase [Caproiciproducens galactitolivorans]|uniref:Tagatose-6-phosphate kinase n=1 Tax=Caproiciproducens galactitolivorans TaxID=642589 RepID=A0A4Z0XX18_9FIRM|nr:1-phosphofructokinase [Caproiciproducens galactitolivorans]QEY34796.1 1-phosphofructokinase [Caproiciproducens galactitolivorans]TGJ75954.1 tagatose-6-phosphate kinase [Caproiciproducens galactitolivorans]